MARKVSIIRRIIFVTVSGAATMIAVVVAFALTLNFIVATAAAIIIAALCHAIRRVWSQHMPPARDRDRPE